jgi:hypothetical protein
MTWHDVIIILTLLAWWLDHRLLMKDKKELQRVSHILLDKLQKIGGNDDLLEPIFWPERKKP